MKKYITKYVNFYSLDWHFNLLLHNNPFEMQDFWKYYGNIAFAPVLYFS